MAIDAPDVLRARARRAYERGRARRALIGALPLVGISIIAGLMDHRWTSIAAVGSLLVAIAAVFLWRGRGLGRGVLPGAAVGIIPFTAVHVAQMVGHVCAGNACWSLCIPVCVVAGVVAGLVMGQMARRSDAPLVTCAAGGAIAALVGALGCACVGASGIAGLSIGLLVGSVPVAFAPAIAGGRS